MKLDIVDHRPVSDLAEADLTQVCGGFWPAFVAGAVASAIIGDAAGNFIDGFSDAIAENLGGPSAGGV